VSLLSPLAGLVGSTATSRFSASQVYVSVPSVSRLPYSS
jgi:hypothetical protein